MRKKVVIGFRGSRLAEVQARSVLNGLASCCPDVDFILTKIATIGDKKKTIPIEKIPGYGAFVKELQEALFAGQIDLAVHSLKDLPVVGPPGLVLAAITERADPRDAFISMGGKLKEVTTGSTIGTSSPRRSVQLLEFRPDLKVKTIRGNVDTRVGKVLDGEFDGIIVAAAGLIRLGLRDKITEYLPEEYFLPQPGQGALAVEIRAEDNLMHELVQPVHHIPTWQSVEAERIFLQAMGGGCSAAIACLGKVEANTIRLKGMAVSRGKPIYAAVEGEASVLDKLAQRLAQELVDMGAQTSI